MKFFLPDASDFVDPTFDFITETRSATRVRQRDDLYIHEVFSAAPMDGYLLSKAIVDGLGGARYTIAQQQRLLRNGIRDYLRLESHPLRPRLLTMGDCGAFSYVKEEEPPFSVDDVLDFYETCGFDLGLSVDHVILDYRPELDSGLPGINLPPEALTHRQELTLALAAEFLAKHKARRAAFVPVGVAQGWSPASYAHSVAELQRIGFTYIALGGLVPLRTPQLLDVLSAVSAYRERSTKLHLLGIARLDAVPQFATFGVASFDSTSPLRQAFKDERDNYYTPSRTYPAIRVPQVDENPRVQQRTRSGEVDAALLGSLEKRLLSELRDYDKQEIDSSPVLKSLTEYERLCFGEVHRAPLYQEVLKDRPWKQCKCEICAHLGIEVMLFRGAERNRRRGFHNLYVFYQGLGATLEREKQ